MVSKAIDYGLSIVGAPYVWWTHGPVPARGPAWAENGPPPPPEEVIAEGCFCAGVPNLMLRAVGKEIPTLGDELYDGGCLAYGEYYNYYGVAEPFDINEDYPEGTLIGRYFDWDRLAANGDQGHVAVVLEGGYLLQSYDGDGYGYPGVNTNAHITDSHAGYYYEYAVRPENWIGLDGDESEAWDGYEGSGGFETTGSEAGISLEQLQSIMPNLPDETALECLPHLNAAMAEGEITTPLRQAAFLAQLAHESGELQWFEEFADGWAYEWREDLGNVSEGDGPRYKGRGPIQLTGRHNYTRAGEALGLDLVNDPECVATPEVGFRTACWYWTSGSSCGDLNFFADVGDQANFDEITRCINGGYNGKLERDGYYWYAREVLGT